MALDRNFWTGLFVLGSAAVGLGVFGLSAMHQFQPNVTRYSVTAKELAGAAEGCPVVMNGYELGMVERVEVLPTPRLHFNLTIAIRPEVTIPQGTVGILAARTVAGGVVLKLVPPEHDTTALLAPGAVIDATAEATLPELIASARGTLENIDAVIAELRVVIVDGPDGKEGISATVAKVNAALESIDRLVRSVQAMRDVAGPAVQRDLAHLDRSLASADLVVEDVHGLVKDDGSFPMLVAHLNESLVQLDAAAKAVQQYDPHGDTDIARVVSQLDEASNSMKRFMASFEKRPLRTLTKGDDADEAPKRGRKKDPAAEEKK